MSELPPPPPPPPATPPPPPMVPAPGPAAAGSKNWMGILSLVAGILGILGACCGFFGLLWPAVAIIVGVLSKKAAANGEATNGNLGNIGFILGIVGAVIALLVGIVLFAINGSYYYNPVNY